MSTKTQDTYQILINKNEVWKDTDFQRTFRHYTDLQKQTSGYICLVKNGLTIRYRKEVQ